MDTTAYVSLSRAVALDRQMAMIAQNVANVGTSGYRAERLAFEAVLERAGGRDRVAFVQDLGPIRDRTDAPLISTGEQLDLAIGGEGFFSIQTAEGVRYSRAGHFHLDREGRIVARDGGRLLDADGAPIELPPETRTVTLGPDGTLSADGVALARLQPVTLPEGSLVREGGSRYASAATPVPAVNSPIQQGAVTGSDVQPVVEMARMIETQRAFEGAIRMIETHHDLVRRTVERTGGTPA